MKKLRVLLLCLILILVSCRPNFKTKKEKLDIKGIESIEIVVEGDSIRCSWLELSEQGIRKFVEAWNLSEKLIGKIDDEHSHPTLGLQVHFENGDIRHFSTFGQYIQENKHDFFLDFSDKDFFMKLETMGPSASVYGASSEPQIVKTKPSVLVLPPYDLNVGRGISPPIRAYMEALFSRDTSLVLIPLPSKKLMHEPHSNVFDKKFCQNILKVIPCDYVIMSKIEQEKETGKMNTAEFSFQVKIYDVKANTQFMYPLTKSNEHLTDELIKACIANSDLCDAIKYHHN